MAMKKTAKSLNGSSSRKTKAGKPVASRQPQNRLASLQTEIKSLRQRLRETEAERDDFRNIIHGFLKKEFGEFKEEDFHIEDYIYDMKDMIKEAEQLLKGKLTTEPFSPPLACLD